MEHFPWDWNDRIRKVEIQISKRMRSRGLNPPPNLFCPFEDIGDNQGLCPDCEHPHKLVASIRAEKAINIWGPHLFPLINDAEVKLKGIRDMPNYQKNISRSNYYGVTGVVDVLSTVSVDDASSKNLIIKYLQDDPDFQKKIHDLDTDEYEIIVDYKGMNRPSPDTPTWQHHYWQVQTYAWLRSLQTDSKPVVVGILFYLNELQRFKKDLIELKGEIERKDTDIMPTNDDLKILINWEIKSKTPILSESYQNLRSIRIIPIESWSLNESLIAFDNVVADIENNIISEINGNGIQNSWHSNSEQKTCEACDFKTFCNNPDTPNKLTIP